MNNEPRYPRIAYLLGLLALSLLGFTSSAAADRPPNFVVIFADDLGYQDLGCFGSPDIRTPRLDAMAEAGMRFTSFYAQPVCGPSRAALMTGCYPLRVAERGNIKEVHPILHNDEVTVAEILKSKGYATACFGKWDLAKHSQSGFFMDLFPTRQGFDYFFGTPTSNDSIVNLYRNEDLIEHKSDMSTLTKRYTDEALAFMKEHKDRPFFVYIPHTMPHTRLDASEQFKGNSPRGLYGAVVEEIDFNVGRVLDAIEEMGLEENTYVLFTSDNGPWLIKNKDLADGHLPTDHGGSAGPLRSGKVSTWEGGVRVPTVLWGPGRVSAGTTCDKIASTLDILPTFAALAQAETPKDRVIDGEDISRLFHGQFDQANPDKAFFYYLRVHLQAVRQGKWKLHLARDAQPAGAAPFAVNRHIAPADRVGFDEPFLVDLENDIGETTNVAERHPEVVTRLLRLAEAMRDDLGDYDRVGKNMRFFDPMDARPTKPPVPPGRKPKQKKRAPKQPNAQKPQTGHRAQPRKQHDQPNVLLIMTDQQSGDAMSCRMGTQYINTPSMDLLASEGMVFTRAYSSNPLCMPLRASLFTGRYPHETGVTKNGRVKGGLNPNEFVMMGTYFRNAGYEAAYSGKWHLCYSEKPSDVHGCEILDRKTKLSPPEIDNYDSRITHAAAKFLDRKHDRPFLLVVSYMNPHNICEWARRAAGRKQTLSCGEIGTAPAADSLPPPPPNLAPPKNEPDGMALMRRGYHASSTFPVGNFTTEDWRRQRWGYYRMIEKVDGEIGKVLDALRRAGDEDRTLVIFTSDHGDCTGAHGFNQKTVFYDESVRVPLIVRWKGKSTVGVSDKLVNTGIDILPTMLACASLNKPGRLPGRSLLPVALGQDAGPWRNFVISQNHMAQAGEINGFTPTMEGRMVRTDRYKYCVYSRGIRRESLIDMVNDPGEMTDLACDPEYRDLLLEHREILARFGREHSDSLVDQLLTDDVKPIPFARAVSTEVE